MRASSHSARNTGFYDIARCQERPTSCLVPLLVTSKPGRLPRRLRTRTGVFSHFLGDLYGISKEALLLVCANEEVWEADWIHQLSGQSHVSQLLAALRADGDLQRLRVGLPLGSYPPGTPWPRRESHLEAFAVWKYSESTHYYLAALPVQALPLTPSPVAPGIRLNSL